MTGPDPALGARYDEITSQMLSSGIDIDRFFGNPSYFKIDCHGNRNELAGRHITTVHFPIEGYEGGVALTRRFTREVAQIETLVGPGAARWIAEQSRHSTVFSPVHSSNPDKIAAAAAILDHERVRRELRETRSYLLRFTRILVTASGAVIAVAHPSDGELAGLRRRLEAVCPGAKAGELVHVTLGQLVSPPNLAEMGRLKDYVRSFSADAVVLGQLKVDFLTYGDYVGPFLGMTIHEVSLERLRKPHAAPLFG